MVKKIKIMNGSWVQAIALDDNNKKVGVRFHALNEYDIEIPFEQLKAEDFLWYSMDDKTYNDMKKHFEGIK